MDSSSKQRVTGRQLAAVAADVMVDLDYLDDDDDRYNGDGPCGKRLGVQ